MGEAQSHLVGRPRRWACQRAPNGLGFTLLEMLIAVLLVTVGVSWALQANVTSLRLAAQAHTALLAVKGVQEYSLEFLRSRPFNDATLVVGGPWPFTTPTLTAGDLPGGNVQYWVDLVSPNLKRVTVQVNWTDPDGRARSSAVSTLISCGGLTDPAACP